MSPLSPETNTSTKNSKGSESLLFTSGFWILSGAVICSFFDLMVGIEAGLAAQTHWLLAFVFFGLLIGAVIGALMSTLEWVLLWLLIGMICGLIGGASAGLIGLSQLMLLLSAAGGVIAGGGIALFVQYHTGAEGIGVMMNGVMSGVSSVLIMAFTELLFPQIGLLAESALGGIIGLTVGVTVWQIGRCLFFLRHRGANEQIRASKLTNRPGLLR